MVSPLRKTLKVKQAIKVPIIAPLPPLRLPPPKTTAAIAGLAREKLPFISVLTDPTMGGVSASFAFMGDVVIAEPRALIGFAGPRVIEQTVREKLPEGFQRSEFLLKKGAIDMIVDRREMRANIAEIMAMLMRKRITDAD